MKKFTLIELLVVVAIIGILASLLLPSMGKARERARAAVCMSNAKQITIATMLYYDDNDAEMPIDNIIDHDTRWFNLLANDYLSRPKKDKWAPEVCKCPSGIDLTAKWQSNIAMNSKITGKNQNGSDGVVWTTNRKTVNKVVNTNRTVLMIDSFLNWRSLGSGSMTTARLLEEPFGGKIARHLKTANVVYLDGSATPKSVSFLLSTGQWDNPFWHPEK
jgi:prepilin-type N-terminal cleavage/methylation domain-containing protein/prepilin-type processing-associated H-X9-DG protein